MSPRWVSPSSPRRVEIPGQVDGHLARRTVTSGPVQGRWTGKPVEIRRGPATVTGDAERRRLIGAAATGPPRAGREGARGGPGSQETSLRPQSREALVERGGSHAQALVRPGGRNRAARRGAGRRRAGDRRPPDRGAEPHGVR